MIATARGRVNGFVRDAWFPPTSGSPDRVSKRQTVIIAGESDQRHLSRSGFVAGRRGGTSCCLRERSLDSDVDEQVASETLSSRTLKQIPRQEPAAPTRPRTITMICQGFALHTGGLRRDESTPKETRGGIDERRFGLRARRGGRAKPQNRRENRQRNHLSIGVRSITSG